MATITKDWPDGSGDKLFLTIVESGVIVESDFNNGYVNRSIDLSIKLVGFDLAKTVKVIQEGRAQELIILGDSGEAFTVMNNVFITDDQDSVGTWSIAEEIPGNRYFGSYIQSSTLLYDNQNDITIEGKEFINSALVPSIDLRNCSNVIIKNCRFETPNTVSIYAYGCTNIVIQDCTFKHSETAIRISSSSEILIEYNEALNIGRYRRPEAEEYGQFVGLIACSGPINIRYNSVDNDINNSSTEDIISTYMSNGTSVDLIVVENNWIRGSGPSETGSAINLTDYGGTYCVARNNIIVNPGNCGIAITGGQNNTLENNIIVSIQLPNSRTGMIVYNWTPVESGAFENIRVNDNRFNFIRSNGTVDNWWVPDMTGITEFNNNVYDNTLSTEVLPAKILRRLTID